ncbi:LOW QUALITY PROTEIN: hypothetical protein Cgig2_022099 [Carnegiea gigantea]|uniref:Transposase n=1 Tax=Carnegiea gigantea TaxID=171969 RepID=A0A9Q1JLU9_9CARY|nr:LOW QUALITY PROTEIN: hypothetical protein Cgig2_022099 [Carnegiea gigantea]
MHPADEGFHKRVLKHVVKHFKQYKHERYFKPEEKTKEDMYEIVPKGHSREGWMRLANYWCSEQHEVETHGREPTHLELFKKRQSKESGGFVANTTTEGFLNKARSKVQERHLSSSPLKTRVEIENEVFDELMYEEENPNDVFGVNAILKKRCYTFPDNNMELKCGKEELGSQKAMFLLMLKAIRNGKIRDDS